MQIIKIKEVNIKNLVQSLKNGQTIVYPTETCYGLGCDAVNNKAVEEIFNIKQRQQNKPVLILVSDIAMAKRYVEWPPVLEELSQKYWPGALTAVVKIKDGVVLPSGVVGSDKSLAFRVTNHPFASLLCKKLQGPIVSTSANIAAHESPYDINSVLDMFESSNHKPDIIIDSGVLPHRSPSTVVRVRNENIEILRQGEVVLQ